MMPLILPVSRGALFDRAAWSDTQIWHGSAAQVALRAVASGVDDGSAARIRSIGDV
jgi:hypothetical protein